MARPASGKPGITPAQHQRLREQLKAIMGQIGSGQTRQAAASLKPLIRKYPAQAEVAHVASGLHARLGEHERAIYHAQRAVELAPGQAEYHAALGTLLVQSDRHGEALGPLDTALRLRPGLRQAMVALGIARMQTGEIDGAREIFEAVLREYPDDIEAANNLALLESDTAHAHRAVEVVCGALERVGEDPMLLDGLCMYASYDDELSPEEVFAIHRRFGESVQRRVRTPGSYANTPDPERRIRVGFVSPDLRTHSVAYFLRPIFEHLDRGRFEVCVYSTTAHPDAMTGRLRAHADQWRDCNGGIADTHRRIAADRVDVLIELTGHFAGNLLPLFAARPAPVGVTMIGYGNTTGLGSIDARIVDAVTDPAPGADGLASEKLVRLPGCFLCYRPPEDAGSEPRDPEPGRPFTFGSFNDLRKLSPSNLRLWARILDENPGSRLVLKTSRLAHAAVRTQLAERFGELGVDPGRVDMLGRTATAAEHLELYNTIDCALDTFPYTGTTTTCEALWMGVPTVTLMGGAHAGRVSGSLLTAVGRADLIAVDEDGYAALAARHAAGGTRSAADRVALRERLIGSPLCDGEAYARKLGAALGDLWCGWCAGKGGA